MQDLKMILPRYFDRGAIVAVLTIGNYIRNDWY